MKVLQREVNAQVLRSREWISTALLYLMKTKDYHKITISEITKKAGVSRQTFYRNYQDKDDILMKYLEVVFSRFMEDARAATAKETDIKRVGTIICIKATEYFRDNSDTLMTLIRQGIDNLVLKEFIGLVSIIENHFNNKQEGHIKCHYNGHFLAGGIYFTLIEWIKRGMPESSTQMGEYLYSILHLAIRGQDERLLEDG